MKASPSESTGSRTEINTAEMEMRASGIEHNLWSPGSRVRRAEMRQGTRESNSGPAAAPVLKAGDGSLTSETMTREAVRGRRLPVPTYL